MEGDSTGIDETPPGSSATRVNPFSSNVVMKKEMEVEHLTRDLQVIGLNSGIGQTPQKLIEESQSASVAQAYDGASVDQIAEQKAARITEPKAEQRDNAEQSAESNESALEKLAKNLEAIGKYRALDNDVKEFDMVAFKVFAPTFQMSNYVIGMVEGINRMAGDDFDLTLLIMGKSSRTMQFYGVIRI